MNYQLTWVLGRFAENLAEERQAFHDAAGEYNEAEGMGRGTLLTPVSCASVTPGRRADLDSNIRMCHYYVLAAEDAWDASTASFRHDYNIALKAKADPHLPLREIVVLFRILSDCEEGDPRLAAFRQSLDPAVRQIDFVDATEFKACVTALFSEWMEGAAA